MRKKKFFKKLALTKETIAHLSNGQMRVAIGGGDGTQLCDTLLDCTIDTDETIVVCTNKMVPPPITYQCS